MKMSMNMTELNQFQKDIIDALGIIYKNFLIQNKRSIEVFLGDFRTSKIDPETFFDTVFALKKHGIGIDEYDRDSVLSQEQKMGARNTPCCEIQLPENFEMIYHTLRNEYGDRSEKSIKENKKSDVLYLNPVGDLWREPKQDHCYSMGENSDRHKILLYLIKNKGYQSASLIVEDLPGKSEQVTRTEIQKINKNFTKNLGKKMGKLIDGRKGSGYRIAHAIKIDKS